MKETQVIDKVLFLHELDIDHLRIGLGNVYSQEFKTIYDALLYFKGKGLDILVDRNYQGDTNISDYGKGFTYEVNIKPWLEDTITRLQFVTEDFDEEEFDALLTDPNISKVYQSDESFRLLVTQMGVFGTDWKILRNYLTEHYKFNFTVIFYETSNQDS